jgi:hypothetical protein
MDESGWTETVTSEAARFLTVEVFKCVRDKFFGENCWLDMLETVEQRDGRTILLSVQFARRINGQPTWPECVSYDLSKVPMAFAMLALSDEMGRAPQSEALS